MKFTRRSLFAAVFAGAVRGMSFQKDIWEKDPRSDTPLFRFVADRKAGFINREGKVVIPARFPVGDDNMGFDDFFEGVSVLDRLSGVAIDANGDRLDFGAHRITGHYSSGLIPVDHPETRRTIFLNKSQQQAIDRPFDSAQSFSEGLAAVRIGDRHGYIDSTGALVIEARYWDARDFSGGVARVAREEPCESSASFPGYGPPTHPPCRYSLIDRKGVALTQRIFEACGNFSDGLARAQEGRAWGFIDKSGGFVIPPSHYFVDSFSEGLAAYEIRNGIQWGYLDKQGATVIQPAFDRAGPFRDGAAVVGKRLVLSWYIDKSGNKLFDREFKAAGSFHLGLAHVDDWEQMHWIDRTGRAVFSYPRPE